MPLSNALQHDVEELKPPWQMCAVRWAVSIAEGEDRSALIKAIGNRNISGDRIADLVREHLRIPIRGESVRRHRRHACRCPQ